MKFEEIPAGITASKGFMASGISCGVKKGRKKDLAIIFSETEAQCAGVFTQNSVTAAPVIVSKENIYSGSGQAVVINSGCANAFTGKRGIEDAIKMTEYTATQLGIDKEQVLVASTGVIGDYLPMEKIEKGIVLASQNLSASGNLDAAEAIMTTDTHSKEIAVEFVLDGKLARIGGMAKGAGMIAPNMATMLAFLTTDVRAETSYLQALLKDAAAKTFNMITIDGETSTNDMVIILANGAAEATVSNGGTDSSVFKEALEYVCSILAKMIVKDGEGATKFVKLTIKGAQNKEEARQVGMVIANSVLVKTAFYGEDANLGRIVAAAGHSGIDIDPSEVELFIASNKVAQDGCYVDFDESKVNQALKQEEFDMTLVIGKGPGEATIWTTDLSHEYIDINSKYRS